MQAQLENILTQKYYTIEELIEILGLKPHQAYKAFKKLSTVKGIKREDAIFRLMGNSFYL
jgi:predicted transcriptional regulator